VVLSLGKRKRREQIKIETAGRVREDMDKN
jgi:hypothetical protein